jgi:two-component system sensor histidine kinase SenX3
VSIRVSEEADRVRFDVVDQGVGIPSEDLPKVRQRFVRGRTARSPGNGLGLAIVSRIAADHGGALEMTSAVGRGTTASLTIPKAEC